MSKAYQLLEREHVASIRDVQRNPSKSLRGITRVMKGSTTIGFFFSNEELDELLEDLEASSSTLLRGRVAEARKDLKKGCKNTVPLESVAKRYGL